jgi:prepilin-type N-terminal cleavage/methylation domain-containing protein
MCGRGQIRRGFSLVELVVVVMILGILAAIAAPHLLGTSQRATDNAARQSLGVIRNAIDHYAAEHGGDLPGADGSEETLKGDLASYLRGSDFPTCPVGKAKNNHVRMAPGDFPVSLSVGATTISVSWVYQYEIGEFHINSMDPSYDGTETYDQF